MHLSRNVTSLAESLHAACEAFSLGVPLGQITRGDADFHDVFRLRTRHGMFALKKIRPRTDLAGWMHRFERSFQVERTLWNGGATFIAEPIATSEDDGLLSVVTGSDVPDVYICHRWTEGMSVTSNNKTTGDVGTVIAHIAQLDIAALVDHEDGPEDDAAIDADEFATTLKDAGLVDGHTSNLIARRLDEVFSSVMPANGPRIVAHRDLRLENMLYSNDRLVVFDWENVDATTLGAEVARTLVHLAYGLSGSQLSGLAQTLVLTSSLDINKSGIPDASWFADWLHGHTAFTCYLLGQTRSRNRMERIRHDTNKLVWLVEHFDECLSALRCR